jgi:hypothetical protein
MIINSRRFSSKSFVVIFSLLLLLLATPHIAVAQTQTNTVPTSGNAGIGTMSPTEKLEVVGTVKASGGVTITGAPAEPAYLNALYLGMNGNTATIDALDQMVDFRDLVISAKTLRMNTWNGGVLVTGLFQNTSGNVGIGTITPSSSKLHVFNNTGGDATVLAEAGSSMSPALEFKDAAATPNRWRIGSGWNTTTDGLFFIYDKRQSAARMIIDASGNVGVGTSSPGGKFDVQLGDGSDLLVRAWNSNTNSGAAIFRAAASSGGNEAARIELTDNTGYNAGISADHGNGLIFRTGNQSSSYTAMGARMTITAGGNVGIGTTSPAKKLDVVGDVNASGTITGGSIVAKYQDVAEWVPASHSLPAGTVVTLDPTKSNHVEASSHAYDTRVAGVVSAQPGITLGEKGESKVLVATTGRVKVMVDASSGPIQVGDLLVTSNIRGVAKKSEPLLLGGVPIHRPGTLIGKALEPLAKGRGEILVLLSLQ